MNSNPNFFFQILQINCKLATLFEYLENDNDSDSIILQETLMAKVLKPTCK